MEAAGENRDVSIKFLRPRTKALISDLLNPQMFIPAPNGLPRYWQGLAGLCNIDANYEASLMHISDPTSKVLNLWCEKDPKSSTVQQFLHYLEQIDRFDIIVDIIELIDEDIRVHRANPQGSEVKPVSLEADKYIITPDDVIRLNEGRELENFDAFLLYDQDDIDFAVQVLETMEKDYNMKFCVKDRDLVGGGLEMEKMITLITERCNRVVVILSDSFFNSSLNDYYIKFAQAFGIEKDRKIIPIEYKDMTNHPTHLKYIFTLNYRRMIRFNFWDKLRDSIQVVDPERMKVTRSKSDNGQVLKSVLHETKDSTKLKPLQHAVKFRSVGDLNNLDTGVEEPPPVINPSTSADNLEQKKEKKRNIFTKFKKRFKKNKSCVDAEHEKEKGFRKHVKRAAVVAN